MDQKLWYEEIERCCGIRKLTIYVDSAQRMVIGAFLEEEFKTLADTAEVTNPQILEMHKSGLELCRLLKHNFDRESASSAMSILESIRNVQAAKNTQDEMSSVNALERPRQEHYRQAFKIKGARVREDEDA